MTNPDIRSRLESTYNSSPGNIVRNCTTCAHCAPSNNGTQYDHCILAGVYCSVQRRYPNSVCNRNLSGWTPKHPHLSPPPQPWVQANLNYTLMAVVGAVLLVIFIRIASIGIPHP